MIRLEGISRQYDEVHALSSVDLEIRQGEWLGLAGPNGSGKTTLLRIILGLTRPSAGKVYIEGKLREPSSWAAFKRKVGYMPERISFYDNLTGEETLRYFAAIRGASTESVPVLLEQVGLADAGSRKVGGYSKGMRQRINLAQALLGDPEVLILDEPTEGLDPHAVRHFFTLLRGTKEHSRTVLLSSHRLGELEGRADRVCILGGGKVKALGTTRELMARLEMRSRVHIILSNGAVEQHRLRLEKIGFTTANELPGHFIAEVGYGAKAGLLERLYSHGIELQDVWIDESDLEEVYFESH